MVSTVLKTIYDNYKITDYLAKKGINPTRKGSKKLFYKCPLPHHKNDREPSFCVYDKPEGQDYWCFGCKHGSNIVSLYACMEGISYKKALKHFCNNLNIDIEDHIDMLVREVIREMQKAKQEDNIVEKAFALSVSINDYLIKNNFDAQEITRCEKIFTFLDGYVKNNDYSKVKYIYQILPTMLINKSKK